MTTPIPDLWPPLSESEQLTPVVILRQQGLLLGQKTNNVVYGEVRSRSRSSNTFEHTLEIVAPFLGYKYPLIVATHQVDVYPVDVGRVAPGAFYDPNGLPRVELSRRAENHQQFIDHLKSILNMEDTARLLRTLVSQSVEPEPVSA